MKWSKIDNNSDNKQEESKQSKNYSKGLKLG